MHLLIIEPSAGSSGVLVMQLVWKAGKFIVVDLSATHLKQSIIMIGRTLVRWVNSLLPGSRRNWPLTYLGILAYLCSLRHGHDTRLGLALGSTRSLLRHASSFSRTNGPCIHMYLHLSVL